MGLDRGVQFEMKIRVLSDLHLEFQDWVPPKSDADIVVLAGDIPGSIDRAMAAAQHGMSDFHLIRYENGPFRPADARAVSLERIGWLRSKLSDEFAGATIVVTHHLPLRQSVHPKYSASDLNPAFASDLDDLMGPPISLWIHGHTHESFDYRVKGTRVVCNPRGYLPMEPNAEFDPLLTVDVPATRGA